MVTFFLYYYLDFWQSYKLETNECDLFLKTYWKYFHKYLTQSLIDSMEQKKLYLKLHL